MTDDRSPPASAREMAEKIAHEAFVAGIVSAHSDTWGHHDSFHDWDRSKEAIVRLVEVTLTPLLAEIEGLKSGLISTEERAHRAELAHKREDRRAEAAESALTASREREGRLVAAGTAVKNAWEKDNQPPGGNFTPRQIENWLRDDMKPAMDFLRAVLSEEAG